VERRGDEADEQEERCEDAPHREPILPPVPGRAATKM
jgi:hypothetical protein